MRIYSKNHFVRGGILAVFAILSMIVLLIKGLEFPFADVLELGVLSVICLIFSGNSFYIALNKNAVKKEAIEENDERALLIKWKSGSLTYSVMNYGLLVAIVGAIIFYSVTKSDFIIPILLTLTIVWAGMGILKLVISIMQEKKN